MRRQAEGGGSSHLSHRTALGGRFYYYPRWSNLPQLVRFRAGTQTPNPKSALSPMLSPLCSQCCCVGNDWQGRRAGGGGRGAGRSSRRLSPCMRHKKLTVSWKKAIPTNGPSCVLSDSLEKVPLRSISPLPVFFFFFLLF